MGMLEDAGQVIDQEMEKLRRFLRTEVKPTTLRGAADALRATSRRLSKLAEDFEARLAENKSETKP
ncbi:MAG: hypothetical protein ACRD5W_16335 [Candidatus Acidiferrales bacterium]